MAGANPFVPNHTHPAQTIPWGQKRTPHWQQQQQNNPLAAITTKPPNPFAKERFRGCVSIHSSALPLIWSQLWKVLILGIAGFLFFLAGFDLFGRCGGFGAPDYETRIETIVE